MPTVKVSKARGESNKETVKIIQEHPDALFGVKTNRVYSQIAKAGRNPHKSIVRVALINALAAAEKSQKKGKPFRIQYVPMTGKDIEICFGKDVLSLPMDSFIVIEGIEKNFPKGSAFAGSWKVGTKGIALRMGDN